MKDYSNPSRKPMMYGGESRTKAQMGGMQASSDTNMRPNRMNKDESGRNYQMAMTAANMQNRTKMAMGGKTKMAEGGKQMKKDPKTGEMKPTYAMDGKGKMAMGGKTEEKKKGMMYGGTSKKKK